MPGFSLSDLDRKECQSANNEKLDRKREVKFVVPKNVQFAHFDLAHFLRIKGQRRIHIHKC